MANEICASCNTKLRNANLYPKYQARIIGVVLDFQLCYDCDAPYCSKNEKRSTPIREAVHSNLSRFVLTAMASRQLGAILRGKEKK